MADANFTLRMTDMLTGPADRMAKATARVVEKLQAGASAALINARAAQQSANAASAAASAAGNHARALGAQVAAAQAAAKASSAVAGMFAAEAAAGDRAQRAMLAKEGATRRAAAAARMFAEEAIKGDRAQRAGLAGQRADRFAAARASAAGRMFAAEAEAGGKALRVRQQLDRWWRVEQASRANAARAGVRKATGRVAGTMGAGATTFAQRGQAAAQRPVAAAAEGGGLLDSLMGSMTAANLLASGIQRVAQGLQQAVMFAANLAVSFGRAVIQAAMFNQRMSNAFSMIMGSAAAGEAQLKWARKFAEDFGMPLQETIEAYKTILGMKLGEKQSRDLMLLVADMKAFGLSGEQTSGIMRQLMQIMSKGKLQGEELLVLAENGISIDLVYKNLGKSLGKTTDEIRKMQAAGKITSAEAMKAIQATILEMTGGKQLGDAAKKNAATFEGTWNRLSTKLQGVMLDIGAKVLPVLEKTLAPMMEKVIAFFKSPEGEQFVANLAKTVGQLAEMLAGLVKSFAESSGGLTTLKIVLAGIAALVQTIAAPFRAIAFVLEQVGAAVEWVISKIRSAGDIGTPFANLNGILATMTGMLQAVSGALSAVTGAVQSLVGGLAGLSGQCRSVGFSLGASIAAGMVGGIGSGAPSVYGATSSLAAGSYRPGLVGGGYGGGNTVSAPSKISIVIPAAADPQATAAAVYATLETKLAGIIENAALSVGIVGSS